jgi:hypothetical protein
MASGSCSLSEIDMQAQLERYRAIGSGGQGRWISATSVELVVSRAVPDGLVEQTVATERSCCPFFELEWDADARRLAVAVSRGENVPALEVIAGALNI